MGHRIAVCWEVLEETEEEFRSDVGYATGLRDPYPLMAQKAGELYSPRLGKVLRMVSIGNSMKLMLSYYSYRQSDKNERKYYPIAAPFSDLEPER